MASEPTINIPNPPRRGFCSKDTADYLKDMSDPEVRKKVYKEREERERTIANQHNIVRCCKKINRIARKVSESEYYPEEEYVLCDGEVDILREAFEKFGFVVNPVVIKANTWWSKDKESVKVSWEN